MQERDPRWAQPVLGWCPFLPNQGQADDGDKAKAEGKNHKVIPSGEGEGQGAYLLRVIINIG